MDVATKNLSAQMICSMCGLILVKWPKLQYFYFFESK